MKSFVRFTFVVVTVVAFVASMATAQDLQQQLSKLGSDAAVKYITPILSGWGADLNSGFYHSADLHDILGFDVGVKFGLAKITDEDKTYSLTIPAITVKPSDLNITGFPTGATISLLPGVNYASTITANTAVGDQAGTDVKTTGGNAVVRSSTGAVLGTVPIPAGQVILPLPGGFNLPMVPLMMPQLAIGLPFGLEFMLRYVPTVSAGDAGKFNYMGFGLRYDIDQWLPLFPVDIAVHFMTQKLTFKSSADADIFTGKATAYGVEVSKRLFILTVYGGFQLESATLSLNSFTGFDPASGLNITVPGFDVKSNNKSRATLGIRLLLLFINVHAEYSIAKTPILAAGVGISLR